jgi:adenylosuccinate synthase
MKAFAIIGSSYGDEGKGLMTDYICSQYAPDDSLVIRYNGGAQAGHNVVRNGKSHICSQIGAGSLYGCATYLDKDFLFNPLTFLEELKVFDSPVKYFINPECRVTLPYDMIANRLAELSRGKDKHGSCGMGIFETIQRHRLIPVTVLELFSMTLAEMEGMLSKVKEYYADRFADMGKYDSQLFDGIQTIKKIVTVDSLSNIYHSYKNLVFEGAQGLLLSEKHSPMPHLTPSDPGIMTPYLRCKELPVHTLTAIYVTRGYVTRHGVGPLPNECHKDDILLKGHDTETNTTNLYQDHFRYANLDVVSLLKTIEKDYTQVSDPMLSKKISVTCLDQMKLHTILGVLNEVFKDNTGYCSYGNYAEAINEIL